MKTSPFILTLCLFGILAGLIAAVTIINKIAKALALL